MSNNTQLYQRAKELIPGGTQLLSKRPELYAPQRWPAYYREAQGCEVVDVDGRRFVDMTTNGIGSCLLGYAHRHVNQAVVRCVQSGSMCTLNCPAEVELAELLIDLHPWADAVRYCRTGGESMAVAIRIARAATGRDVVAFCGYHGWSDWYLAANLPGDRLAPHLLDGLRPTGVPSGLFGTAIPFRYNQLDELETIVREHRVKLAAIVIEPVRSQEPLTEFLEGARRLAHMSGAALIFDEISSGWRFWLGGAHMKFGVEPDLAVFAKALSNGFAMGAIIGRDSFMDAAQQSFISSTYWTDAIGPVAALATIREMLDSDVPAHVHDIGLKMLNMWKQLGETHSVPTIAGGLPALARLDFDHPQQQSLGTLFTVRMLKRGYLAGSQFYPTLAHTAGHVQAFVETADEVFVELADAIRADDIDSRLSTPVRHTGFRRLT